VRWRGGAGPEPGRAGPGRAAFTVASMVNRRAELFRDALVGHVCVTLGGHDG
jgi:hypothetical protein